MAAERESRVERWRTAWRAVPRRHLLTGGLSLLLLGLVIDGYGTVRWNQPTTCDGAVMAADDRCIIIRETTVRRGRSGGLGTVDREILLRANTLRGERPWELIAADPLLRPSKKVRSVSVQRAVQQRKIRIVMAAGAVSLLASAGLLRAWWVRPRHDG